MRLHRVRPTVRCRVGVTLIGRDEGLLVAFIAAAFLGWAIGYGIARALGVLP